MSFIEQARATEDIAAGLTKFLSELPDNAATISITISELFAISASLRVLEDAHNSPQLRRNFNRIINDVELITRSSLRLTLTAVFDWFGSLDGVMRGGDPSAESYRRIWNDMWTYFYQQAGYSLNARLYYYNIMLQQMRHIVRDEPTDHQSLARLREEIKVLRATQDRENALRAEADRRRQAPDPRRAAEPAAANMHPPPEVPVPPAPQARGRTPERPLKSAMRQPRRQETPPSHNPHSRSRSFERERPSPPPRIIPSFDQHPSTFVEPPDSSSSETESTSTVSSIQHPSDTAAHWAGRVFIRHQLESVRPLPPVSQVTRCHGEHMPDAVKRINESYKKLVSLRFISEPDITFHFYLRDSDGRARALCEIHRSKTVSLYATLPMASLRICRRDACLKLCRKSEDKVKPDLGIWTTLKFRSFERMVIFFCAFLALRGQDPTHKSGIEEYEVLGEETLFVAPIIDDHFLHVLRICREKETKAIRLHVAIHKGELEGTPIWTAFIDEHLRSKLWIRETGSKKIILSYLNRVTFIDSHEYQPAMTSKGEHVLKFVNASDAGDFYDIIRKLYRASKKRR